MLCRNHYFLTMPGWLMTLNSFNNDWRYSYRAKKNCTITSYFLRIDTHACYLQIIKYDIIQIPLFRAVTWNKFYFIMDLLSMIFMPTIYLYQSHQGNDIYRYYELYKYYVKCHNIYIQVGTSQVRVNTCFVFIFLNVLFTLLNLRINFNIWV